MLNQIPEEPVMTRELERWYRRQVTEPMPTRHELEQIRHWWLRAIGISLLAWSVVIGVCAWKWGWFL